MNGVQDWVRAKWDAAVAVMFGWKQAALAMLGRAYDVVWEALVCWPFRAVLIALAVGFLVGAIAVGSTYRPALQTSFAVPGVAPHAALTESQPQNTVHFYVGTEGGSCSAVTIAYETLLTAAHCLDGLAGRQVVVTKDGIAHVVYGAQRSQDSDLAIIYAKDVYCPCAKIAAPGNAGEAVVVVGYPRGEYAPAVNGVTLRILVASDFFTSLFGPKPDDTDWPIEYPHARYLWQSGQLIGGHSGGGMFVERNGEWFLVAINSWAFPGIMQYLYGVPSGGAGALPLQSDLHPRFL